MISKTLLASCCLCLSAALPLQAQLTYVDASAANVTRVDGNAFAPSATANAYADTNWTLRTGLASGGTVYEGGGGEAVPMLKQTLTGVAAGYYDVYVFFWVANNVNWQINAGLTAATTNFGSVGTTTTPSGITSLASTATYNTGAAPGVMAEADRTLIRAKVGQATIAAGGTIQVFMTTGAAVNANATNSRTWFDGIGYGPYEPPPPPPGNGVEVAPDGAWTWFNDERSIIHQGSLYSGYVKGNGQTGITRRNLATGANSHMVISTAASQQLDDHNNPSITVLPDGKLTVLYSKHIAGNQFYQRTSLVPLPSTDADWGPEITVAMPAANTYANTYRLVGESNAIYNFSRCINFNPTLTISTNNGATWGTSRQLVGTGSGNTRPYPRYCSNGVDRIDLIYTDGHPRDVDNSVYHMFYRNGGLYKTDGTLIDSLANIPLDHDAGEKGNVIYQFSNAAWGANDGPDNWIPAGRGWTWDVQYGKDGVPSCVFQVQTGTDATWATSRIYYYYARWTGTGWQRKFIAQAGRGIYAAESDYGGGMCLDPEDPRVVYISTNAANPFSLGDISNVPLRANNRYEIYKGFTADGGLTFTWTQITVNSTSDNLRPIVPPDHGRSEFLVWFNGTYTSYTNFSTKVYARVGDPLLSYNSWAQGFGVAATSPLDSDADGMDNLAEFALAGNPVNGADIPTQVWADGKFSFPYPPDRSGVEWHVQESQDLGDWQTVAILRTGDLPNQNQPGFGISYTAAPNRRAVVTPSAVTPPTQDFLRVKVVPTK
ncbi:MAG: BNR-4 repeat-containing protein [Verrucomicrobiota bacterium]